MTRDEEITWGERAAVMEYLGKLPRAEAERLALKIIRGQGEIAEQLELLR